MSKTVFKVGMKVYDEVFFPGVEGEIYRVYDTKPLGVLANFGQQQIWYSLDGRCFVFNNNLTPTLSTTPYTVKLNGFSQGEPLKKGQIVWVRDDENDEWIIGHFIGMSSNEEHKYRVSSIPNRNGANWKFLTTKNPYENIE